MRVLKLASEISFREFSLCFTVSFNTQCVIHIPKAEHCWRSKRSSEFRLSELTTCQADKGLLKSALEQKGPNFKVPPIEKISLLVPRIFQLSAFNF